MKKVSIIIFSLIFSTLLCGQGNYCFIFVDGESGDTLTNVEINIPEKSKTAISKGKNVFAFSCYKKKHVYVVKSENYHPANLSHFDFPKKNDTAKILLIPTKNVMEERWGKLQNDSNSCCQNDTLHFQTVSDFKGWFYKRTKISYASLAHCEYFKEHIRMEIHFDITIDGFVKNGTPKYKYNALRCKYYERDLQKALWSMPAIHISNLNDQKLIIPFTFKV